MEREINFAIAQMKVSPGHPDLNVGKILKETELAKRRKVDVIIFPEMAIPGYFLSDEWENDSLIADLMEYNQEILEASKDIAVIWGNVYAEFDKKGEDGRTRKYNAAHIAQDGKWVDNGVFKGHTFKTHMPEYKEFDDPRHFYSMAKLAFEQNRPLEDLLKPFPIEINNKKALIGAIICEDMWWENYAVNPTHILVKNGAEIIVNISCSPWTWRKNDKRHRVVESILKEDPVYFIYNNNVGTQNNGKNIFLFDGNSTVYNPNGSLMLTAHDYKEETVDFAIPSNKELEMKARTSFDEEDVIELHNGLIYGIKEFFGNLPTKKAVIGLSGGIDSAVSACLLTEALGKENVIAVNMPSKFNSELTKNAAKQLADNLDIKYMILPIQDFVNLTVDQLEDSNLPVSSLNIENIQARDRGSRLLASVAASLNGVFVSNSNKTETALGYATLYGDIDGAISPIGDLYKYEIYQMGNYINKTYGKEVIPQTIIDVTPSAELSSDQDVTKGKGDPIIYPYHDKLIRAFVEFRRDPEYILDLYIKGSLESELRIKKGLVKKYFSSPTEFIEDLEQKWGLYKKNYFKRIQSPPNIAVSRRAFGYDLRESQNGVYLTKKYLELKNKLLHN